MIGGKQTVEENMTKTWGLLIFLRILPLSAFEADLERLSREFLTKNFHVLSLKERAFQEELNHTKKSLEKTWSLSGQTAYTDNASERGLDQSPLPGTKKHTYGINIKRDFSIGSSLSLSNEFSGTIPRISTGQKSYGFSQGLSYTQDLGANFFGRSYRSELEQFRLMADHSSSLANTGIEEGLYLFAVEYTFLRLQETLLKLQEEAVERAKERAAFVRQRVLNGLKERVDIYQSQMALLSQEEQLRIIRVAVVSGFHDFSQKLERQVEREELKRLSLDNDQPPRPSQGEVEGHPLLKGIKIDERIKKLAFSRAKHSLWPTINLKLEYRTNDYDPRFSQTFSRGRLSLDPRGHFLSAQASLDMPLDFGSEKAEIQRIGSQIRVNEAEYLFHRSRLEKQKQNTLYQLSEMGEKITSARQRKELAEKALNDYNTLYRQGRADLDQVIRAEEDLIATQKSLAQYLSSRRDLYLLLSSLHGGVSTYLFGSS